MSVLMMIWQGGLCVRATMQIAMNMFIYTVIWGLVLLYESSQSYILVYIPICIANRFRMAQLYVFKQGCYMCLNKAVFLKGCITMKC